MNFDKHLRLLIPVFLVSFVLFTGILVAQKVRFHYAPASADQLRNPIAGQSKAVAAGADLYVSKCASCHGPNGAGQGNVPSLARGPVQSAPDGEVFWFITQGSVANGMPSWASLPEQQRWQLVSYVESLNR